MTSALYRFRCYIAGVAIAVVVISVTSLYRRRLYITIVISPSSLYRRRHYITVIIYRSRRYISASSYRCRYFVIVISPLSVYRHCHRIVTPSSVAAPVAVLCLRLAGVVTPSRRHAVAGTLETTDLVEWVCKDTIISHQVHKRVWPASQRDSVFWSTLCHRPSDDDEAPDTWLVVNHSTHHDDVAVRAPLHPRPLSSLHTPSLRLLVDALPPSSSPGHSPAR